MSKKLPLYKLNLEETMNKKLPLYKLNLEPINYSSSFSVVLYISLNFFTALLKINTSATTFMGFLKMNATIDPTNVFFSEIIAFSIGIASIAFHESMSALPFETSLPTDSTSAFALLVTKYPDFASRTTRCGMPCTSSDLESFSFIGRLSSAGRDIHGIFAKYFLKEFMS